MLLCCGALWAALAAPPLSAQIRIVPRAKLDSLARGTIDRKSTRLNSRHMSEARMPASA